MISQGFVWLRMASVFVWQDEAQLMKMDWSRVVGQLLSGSGTPTTPASAADAAWHDPDTIEAETPASPNRVSLRKSFAGGGSPDRSLRRTTNIVS